MGSYQTPVDDRPLRGLHRGQGRRSCSRQSGPWHRPQGVAFAEASYSAQREWKWFAASDGSETDQEITHVVAALEANAVDGDELQRRSYPDSGQAAG